MVATSVTILDDSSTTWSANNGSGASVTVPDAYLLFNADFQRDSSDLVLSDDRGQSMRIVDYFSSEKTPDLVTVDGARLEGSLVEVLAGPAFPAQYAQATPAAGGAQPIGQVESVSGAATVQRADGTVETLSVSTKVFQNDVVQTADGGTLSITFSDGTIFTLASASRMVLSELVYDPAGNGNSAIFNLVEGSFVFIAGQVAKTGDMEVKTPVATMGIRGTTVKADIETTNGETTVEVSLNRDPDGSLGAITLTDLSGNLIANITSTDTKWFVSPVDGQTREIERTANDLASDQAILADAVRAYQSAQQRVQAGEQFVNQGDGDNPDGNDDNQQDQQQPEDGQNPGDDEPEGQEEGDQRGDSGGGTETEVATKTLTSIGEGGDSSTENLGEGGSVVIDPLGTATPPGATPPSATPSGTSPQPVNALPATVVENQTTNPVIPTDTGLQIILPTLTENVAEDGEIRLTGFTISDSSGGPLTATLVAGSTISIDTGTGVTIVSGTGTNDERLVLEGTASQLTAALNTITYRPSPNDDDGGTLDITVSDGTRTTSERLVIGIDPEQDAPEAQDDAVNTTANDGSVSGSVTANDSDPDTGDTLTLVSASEPDGTGGATANPVPLGQPYTLRGGGTIILNEDSSFTFEAGDAYDRLGPGEVEVETVDYEVTDGKETSTASLNITITGTNEAPTLTGTLSSSVEEGGSVGLTAANLSGVDVDDAPAGLTYTMTSSPANGQVEVVGAPGTAVTTFTQAQINAGEVIYVHNGGETISDSFSFSLADGGEDGAQPVTGTFAVTVTPVNDDPVGTPTATLANGAEDTAYIVAAADLLAGFSDVDDEVLSVANLTASDGSVADNGNGTFTVTPSDDFNGPVTLTYDVEDGNGGSLTGQTLSYTIDAVNDKPTGSPTASLENGAEDTAYIVAAADLLAGFSDVDDEVLSVANLKASDGSVADNGNGTFTVTPSDDFNGSVTLTYDVEDGNGGSLTGQTLSYTIDAVNDKPTGSPTASLANGAEDTAYIVAAADLLAGFSDVDDEVLSVANLTASDGSVADNGNGTFTVTPSDDFNGPVTLTYDVEDGNGGSLTGQTLSYTIDAVNDKPTGSPTASLENGAEDTAYIVAAADLLAGFSDVDDEVLSVANLTASDGSVADNGNGTFTVTPSDDFNGPVTLTYDVEDGNGGSLTGQTLSYTIDAVNDKPTGSPTASLENGAEDTAYIVAAADLLAGFSDVDDEVLSVANLKASDGSVADNGNGTFTVTPSDDFNGSVTLTYDVEDGNGGSLTGQTLSYTIDAVNDAPDVSDTTDPGSVPEGDTGVLDNQSFTLANYFTASDADAGEVPTVDETSIAITPNSASSTALTSPLAVFGTGNDSRVVVDTANYDFLAAGQSGVFDVTFDILSGPDTVTRSLTITITGTNDAPTVSGDLALAVTEGGSTIIFAADLDGTDVDDFGSGLNYTVTTAPALGQIELTTAPGSAITSFTQDNLDEGLVIYASTAEVGGTDSFEVSLVDGGEDSSTPVTATLNVKISGVNDDPTATGFKSGPLPASGNEDTAIDLEIVRIDLADVDSGTGNLTLKVDVVDGALAAEAGSSGVTVGGTAIAMEVTGTLAELNAFLDNQTVSYTPPLDVNGSRTVSVAVTDNGNTGTGGGSDVVLGTIEVDIVSVNDVPILDVSSSGSTEFPENDPPVTIATTVSITDVDDTMMDGATISITENLESEDLLGFTDTATISGSYDSAYGILTLTGTDTLANYKTALESITFENPSDNFSDSIRTISYAVTDGGDFSTTGTATVEPAPFNDAPTIDFSAVTAGPELVTNGQFEDGPDVTPLETLSPGDTSLTGWTIDSGDVDHLNGEWVSGEGENSIDLNGEVQGSISTSIATVIGQQYELSFLLAANPTLPVTRTAELSINGGAPQSFSFDPTGQTTADMGWQYRSVFFIATAAITSIAFTGDPAAGPYGPAIDEVSVRAVVGGAVTTLEDVPLEISNIVIDDIDELDGYYTVTLSADKGALTVRADVGNGLADGDIAGNGTYSVTLSGSLASINETLSATGGLTYVSNLNFKGTDALSISVNDGGSSGDGGPQIGSASLPITVTSVSDAPPASSNIGDVVAGNVATLAGVQFVENAAAGSAGTWVANVGDVNNDGLEDFAIGAQQATGDASGSPTNSGSAYVVYGMAGTNPYGVYANAAGEISLDQIGVTIGGFELVGAAGGDLAGASVAGGGDLNNDGVDDIVVGSPFVDGPLNAGSSFVIYGGQKFSGFTGAEGEISLGSVGTSGGPGGFEFRHNEANENLGQSVSIGGDLNNDGISDIIVGNPTNTATGRGNAWVMFGGQDFGSVVDAGGAFDFTEIPTNIEGFQLVGEAAKDFAGYSVDFIGDFNDDGVDDIIVGALQVDTLEDYETSLTQAGAIYVIYGDQNWSSFTTGAANRVITLSSIGSTGPDGFIMSGSDSNQFFGTTVASAGDVNNDGIDDLIVTSPNYNAGVEGQGVASLIYGSSGAPIGSFSYSDIGTTGLSGANFVGANANDGVDSIASAGDINGDGLGDLLISSKGYDVGEGANLGATYVVFGQQGKFSGTISLADIGGTGTGSIDGFRLVGKGEGNDFLGSSVSAAGDVNGDGYGDLLIGAIGNDDGATGGGAGYLIYGGDFEDQIQFVAGASPTVGSNGRQFFMGTPGDDVIDGGGGGDAISAAGGDDTIIVGNTFFDFIDGGSGTDTLLLSSDDDIDFTNISDGRVNSIETLSIENSLANKLTLSISDVFDLSDDANSTLEGLLSDTLPTSLIIDADVGDEIELYGGATGGWSENTSYSVTGYDIYEYTLSGEVVATLGVDDDVTPMLFNSS